MHLLPDPLEGGQSPASVSAPPALSFAVSMSRSPLVALWESLVWVRQSGAPVGQRCETDRQTDGKKVEAGAASVLGILTYRPAA